jgi:DNA-binding NarL/FixJ family response regulator
MKVIIADDSALILARLQEMLEMYKHVEVVGMLNNGIDALAEIRNKIVDLVIVDLNMPGLTGLEVLKEIRKTDKNLIVIILTFYSSDHHRHLAMNLGANYFFSKVDDFENLSLLIAGMIIAEIEQQKSCPIVN